MGLFLRYAAQGCRPIQGQMRGGKQVAYFVNQEQTMGSSLVLELVLAPATETASVYKGKAWASSS